MIQTCFRVPISQSTSANRSSFALRPSRTLPHLVQRARPRLDRPRGHRLSPTPWCIAHRLSSPTLNRLTCLCTQLAPGSPYTCTKHLWASWPGSSSNATDSRHASLPLACFTRTGYRPQAFNDTVTPTDSKVCLDFSCDEARGSHSAGPHIRRS